MAFVTATAGRLPRQPGLSARTATWRKRPALYEVSIDMNYLIRTLLTLLIIIACIADAHADEKAGLFEVDSLSLKFTFENDIYLKNEFRWHIDLTYKYRFLNIGGHIYEESIWFSSIGGGGISCNHSPDPDHRYPVGEWLEGELKMPCSDQDFSPYDSITCIVTLSGFFEEQGGSFSYSDSVIAPVIFEEE